jgi:Flp pilus assembly protein TadB
MENKIKHLEFIQTNISRMNQCSFQMKGWALTIVTVLLTLYATTVDSTTHGNVAFIFIAIVPTVLFWFLDSYYLQQERKFRGIYK